MIFKIIQSPITNFQKPKNIQSENAKYTKKSESNFSTMRTYTPLQNWVVSVLKKMYQKSASRQHLHCKATLRSRASTLR